MITFTQAAANQVKKHNGTSLRLELTNGGCSGFKHKFYLDTKTDTDTVIETDSIKLLIDNSFIPLLDGAVIDFVSSLEGASFTLDNPNATGCCGCGESFSV